jgi:hypothetical protein
MKDLNYSTIIKNHYKDTRFIFLLNYNFQFINLVDY